MAISKTIKNKVVSIGIFLLFFAAIAVKSESSEITLEAQSFIELAKEKELGFYHIVKQSEKEDSLFIKESTLILTKLALNNYNDESPEHYFLIGEIFRIGYSIGIDNALEKAQKYFSKAIFSEKTKLQALTGICYILIQKGLYREAYYKMIKEDLFPEHPPSMFHLNLAIIYSTNPDFKEAKRHLSEEKKYFKHKAILKSEEYINNQESLHLNKAKFFHKEIITVPFSKDMNSVK